MKLKPNQKWTQDVVDEVRACAARTLSSGETAKYISDKLGKYLSRNTIVGIAMRAKPVITFGARPARGGKKRQKAITLAAPKKIELKKEVINNSGMKAINIRRKRAKLIEELPIKAIAAPESVVADEDKIYTILDLTVHNCHYPMWGETAGPYVFCGLPTAKKPYCAVHRRIAGRQYNTSKRDPSASLTAVTVPEKPPKSKEEWSTMNTRFR